MQRLLARVSQPQREAIRQIVFRYASDWSKIMNRMHIS